MVGRAKCRPYLNCNRCLKKQNINDPNLNTHIIAIYQLECNSLPQPNMPIRRMSPCTGDDCQFSVDFLGEPAHCFGTRCVFCDEQLMAAATHGQIAVQSPIIEHLKALFVLDEITYAEAMGRVPMNCQRRCEQLVRMSLDRWYARAATPAIASKHCMHMFLQAIDALLAKPPSVDCVARDTAIVVALTELQLPKEALQTIEDSKAQGDEKETSGATQGV